VVRESRQVAPKGPFPWQKLSGEPRASGDEASSLGGSLAAPSDGAVATAMQFPFGRPSSPSPGRALVRKGKKEEVTVGGTKLRKDGGRTAQPTTAAHTSMLEEPLPRARSRGLVCARGTR